jgi:hypothetical protein
VFVERREGKGREGSVSHEDEEGAGSPLGLVRVLARLPLPTPGGGLLGALALHHQPAATILLFKIESIDRSVAIERERERRNPHLVSALATPLDLAPFMAGSCVNTNGGGQIRQRRLESGVKATNLGRIGKGEAHLDRTARGGRREEERARRQGRGGGDWG